LREDFDGFDRGGLRFLEIGHGVEAGITFHTAVGTQTERSQKVSFERAATV